MMTRTRNRPRDPFEDDREYVKDLVLDYIRGLVTSEEIRGRLKADSSRGHLLTQCARSESLPQQLLQSVGLSAYEMDLEFGKPAFITREGLRRNLRLVIEGRLSVEALCEWSTDRVAWDIVEGHGCEDDVVRVIADELTHGEDYARRIVSSSSFVSLVEWHLRCTSAQESSNVVIGVFIEHWRASLCELLGQVMNEDASRESAEARLSEFFLPLKADAPMIARLFAAAMTRLAGSVTPDRIEALITCTTRTAQPVACAERILSSAPPL